jgi:small-conductance mechanosensitive channel
MVCGAGWQAAYPHAKMRPCQQNKTRRELRMNFATDLSTVTHGIQLAVAPVFLLTAVSGMIGAVAGRLARIIDRARFLENRLEAGDVAQERAAKMYDELKDLRGWLVNSSLALLTLCAMLIGLTIILLFLGETAELPILKIATISFLAGVVCFLSALVCFLAETFLATRLLSFAQLPVPRP